MATFYCMYIIDLDQRHTLFAVGLLSMLDVLGLVSLDSYDFDNAVLSALLPANFLFVLLEEDVSDLFSTRTFFLLLRSTVFNIISEKYY